MNLITWYLIFPFQLKKVNEIFSQQKILSITRDFYFIIYTIIESRAYKTPIDSDLLVVSSIATDLIDDIPKTFKFKVARF